MEKGKFDEIFLQIAGQSGGIEPLLDEFFGFLSRKTDFYIEYKENERGANMGFPPGVNQRMLINSFKKYPIRKYQSDNATSTSTSTSTASSSSSTHSNNQNNTNNTNNQLKRDINNPIESTTIDNITTSDSNISSSNNNDNNNNNLKINENQIEQPINNKLSTIRLSESGYQIPMGNGGIAEKYYWTQTLKELTVYIDLDFRVKGKDVQCNITPSHLSLSIRGEKILDDNFEDKVCVSESMWVISSDCYESQNVLSQIIITLDKSRKTWWKHVLINDPEIDTTKVDSTQKISEYDDETQAAIRKIMFEQKQKRLSGQLDSDHDIIPPQAYNAPGSPFLPPLNNQDG